MALPMAHCPTQPPLLELLISTNAEGGQKWDSENQIKDLSMSCPLKNYRRQLQFIL